MNMVCGEAGGLSKTTSQAAVSKQHVMVAISVLSLCEEGYRLFLTAITQTTGWPMTNSRITAIVAALIMPISVQAKDLAQTIDRLERQLDARIGVAIHDTASEGVWAHRPHERFLMNSTIKVLVCAAVLARDDLKLTDALQVRAQDVVGHAPVTRNRIGDTMAIADLCLAAVDQSDNGATNILFDRLGGPEHVTAFLRSMGDDITRSDRTEPSLNFFVAGDPRDTTTPAAMVRTLHAILVGDALPPDSQKMLINWMRPGSWTSDLLRPAVPKGWDVADKSGSGRNTRNLVALLTPPSGAPVLVSMSISDTTADFATRSAALAELGAAVMDMLDK